MSIETAKENLEKAKAQGVDLSTYNALLRKAYSQQWDVQDAQEPAQASMSIWGLILAVARTIFLGPERG